MPAVTEPPAAAEQGAPLAGSQGSPPPLTMSGMPVFFLVWLGQLVSMIGSFMTKFALGVWVYQLTGSVTQFALVSLFMMVPAILISPLAGVIIDRWDRRRSMLLSDSSDGLTTLAVVLLLFSGRLHLWHIYCIMAVRSVGNAFRWPAFSAATTLLVPKQHLDRANGMVQGAYAVASLVSPLLAGFLMVSIHLQGVVLIDASTFLFSLVTLLLVRFPRPEAAGSGAPQDSLGRGMAAGWTYIWARPGLLGLLALIAASNFAFGVLQALVTPMVLSFATPAALGLAMSASGCGMLLGSVVLSVRGGPGRRLYGILAGTGIQGAMMLLGGLRPSVLLVATTGFGFMLVEPIIMGSSQAIWQSKVPAELQGRVFAAQSTVVWSALPLAYVLAGPLADYVVEPLLAVGGPWAGSIGRIIGAGPGRGSALLIMGTGLAVMLASLAGCLYPRLWRVEAELPDAVQ